MLQISNLEPRPSSLLWCCDESSEEMESAFGAAAAEAAEEAGALLRLLLRLDISWEKWDAGSGNNGSGKEDERSITFMYHYFFKKI